MRAGEISREISAEISAPCGKGGVIAIGHPTGERLTLPPDNVLFDSKFLVAGDRPNDEQRRLALMF